jgi:hypothetical protein
MAAKSQLKRPHTLPGTRTVGRLTAIFVQGLIALLPLAVTIAIVWWLGVTAERTLGGAIRWVLPEEWYVRGMGMAAGVIVIFLVGLLMNIYGVPKLIHWGERFIGRVPLVKTVYGAVRDLLGFFSPTRRRPRRQQGRYRHVRHERCARRRPAHPRALRRPAARHRRRGVRRRVLPIQLPGGRLHNDRAARLSPATRHAPRRCDALHRHRRREGRQNKVRFADADNNSGRRPPAASVIADITANLVVNGPRHW